MVKKLRQITQPAARPRFETMEATASLRRTPAPAARLKTAKARKFSLRRAGYALLIGICVLAGIGVPMNALFFQDARHPAPMFLTNSSATTSTTINMPKPMGPHTAEITSSALESPKLKTEAGRAGLKSETARNDLNQPAKIGAHQSVKSAEPTKHDPIAELLKGPAKPKTPAESDVLMAQEALLKLGYVVRADGKFTKATQKAIEKFEHDNGMPVKGALTTKVAAMLASRAGLQSE